MNRKREEIENWLKGSGFNVLVCCPGQSYANGGVLFYYRPGDFPTSNPKIGLDNAGRFISGGRTVSYSSTEVPADFQLVPKGMCWGGRRRIEMYGLVPYGPCMFRSVSEHKPDWFAYLQWSGYDFKREQGLCVVAGSCKTDNLMRELDL